MESVQVELKLIRRDLVVVKLVDGKEFVNAKSQGFRAKKVGRGWGGRVVRVGTKDAVDVSKGKRIKEVQFGLLGVTGLT